MLIQLSCTLKEPGKQYLYKEAASSYTIDKYSEADSGCLQCDEVGYVKWASLSASGFILVDIDMKFRKPLTSVFDVSGDSIMMAFLINATGTIGNVEHFDTIKFDKKNTHNLIYTPKYNGQFRCPAHVPIKLYMLIMSPDFYFKMIPPELDIHRTFAQHIQTGTSCLLSDFELPVTVEVQQILKKVRNCKCVGLMKKMLVVNCIQELLLLQHEMSSKAYCTNDAFTLAKDDLLKLEEAKDILENRFISAPSLSALSKMVFLNEFKLKKGFKACYGVTIKSYIIQLRMKYALKLLGHKECSITDIAAMCGYNGLVQFSVAFKKFYGYSPQIAHHEMHRYSV